ncbi:MAG TPA: TolC family protein [Bacteroidia bacterium]
MKKLFSGGIFLLCSAQLFAQQPLNIDSVLNLAARNYPLAKQKGYLLELSDNNTSGLNGAWLPQLNINSRATYQSEVPSFDFPGFPSIVFPKDQYNFGLQLNQLIYDGGITAQQKRTEHANTETEIQKNEVELYKIKDRVIQLYGNILLAKENINLLNSYLDDINSRKKKVESMVKNGTLLQSNLDVLEAEVLKTQQRLIEARSGLNTAYQVLSLLTGQTINDQTTLNDLPQNGGGNNGSGRPELKLFELQQNLIGERLKLANRKTLPRLSVFGDGAYGRPGYNFLNQDFRFYGIAGISLTWNLSSFYNLSYEKKNLQISRKMIDEQKELFTLGQNIALTQQNSEADKLKKEIEVDGAIVNKRVAISKMAADQLDNGTITSSDYLTELNAEKQARLNQRMHEIQLGIALENLKVTNGN